MKKTEFSGTFRSGKLEIADKRRFSELIAKLDNKEVVISIAKKEKQRTLSQNNALHLYFKLLSEAFQDAGLDARAIFKPEVDIPVTADMVKELMWKPIQEIYVSKKGTSELTTQEVTQIYEVINRHISEKFGIHIAFPNVADLVYDL